MAAITWTDVTDFASALSPVPVTAQALILTHVNSHLAPDKWGGEESAKLKLARILLAAHHGTFALPGTNGTTPAGPVSLEMEDDVQRQYAIANLPGLDVDPLYDSTSYGRLFRTLMRGNPHLRGFAVV